MSIASKRIPLAILFGILFFGIHSCKEDNPPVPTGLPFAYFFIEHIFVDPINLDPNDFLTSDLRFVSRAQVGSTAPPAGNYYYEASAFGNEELPIGCSKSYTKSVGGYRTIKIVGEIPRKGTIQPNDLKWLETLRYVISMEFGPSMITKSAKIKFIDYDEEIDFTNNLWVAHGANPENENYLLIRGMNFSPLFRKDGTVIFLDLRFEELDF